MHLHTTAGRVGRRLDWGEGGPRTVLTWAPVSPSCSDDHPSWFPHAAGPCVSAHTWGSCRLSALISCASSWHPLGCGGTCVERIRIPNIRRARRSDILGLRRHGGARCGLATAILASGVGLSACCSGQEPRRSDIVRPCRARAASCSRRTRRPTRPSSASGSGRGSRRRPAASCPSPSTACCLGPPAPSRPSGA